MNATVYVNREYNDHVDGTRTVSQRTAFHALNEIAEALEDQDNNRGAVVTSTVNRDNGIGGDWFYGVRIDHETDHVTYSWTE